MARKTTIRNDDSDPEEPAGAGFGTGGKGVGRGGGSAEDGDSEDPNQQRFDDELRPSRLEDVVGQKAVVERLRILLEATKRRKEPLGHLLLDGPPGLGKTTLATVVPRELGTELQITAGPSLSAPKDLLPYLTNAGYGSVLFIDEIHRMPPAVEEFIYPAMEDFRVDITLGDGLNARTINMKLQPFTLIGATTRSGMLTAPLRDRFVNREHLDFYTDEELATIVTRNARKLRTEIAPEAAQEIAIRSRGTPRKTNNWLRWTRDFADVRANGIITLDVARAALKMKGVDDAGLEEQDRKYLETIVRVFGGGPAGVQALGHTMNIPADTLEDEVEPFLLREGFIQRTPRGRMITAKALHHLGISQKQKPKSSKPSADSLDQRELF
ncbi:MAG TPA: Holliday junction branch migration DNA helicase RuvB [Planctomycetaceae bacterium]|nr:Holliday junction branch migration DNA helicase RuvB [Planctomycetaceae bacterium]